ncbi:MAG: hypothetical protein V4473_00335 [Patescibacteria group bacterium]
MSNNQDENKISNKLLALNALFLLLIICLVFVIYGSLHPQKKVDSTIPGELTTATHAFDNLPLQAKAVYVFDVVKNKVVFQKNAETQLPLASITKLMMAVTASDLLPKTSHITIRKEFLTEEGDSGLLANESWRLKDLLDFSLVVSSNDGARSIASVIGAFDLQTSDYDLGRKDFIEKMNEKAQNLGFEQMYFVNESGLDIGNTSGGYGTAQNVAGLMEYILKNKPDIVEATKIPTSTISSLTTKHTAVNTNTEINRIPGLIASKTGFTDLAGGNLVVAFDASIGRPIIVVVLGSTQDGRFKDIDALVNSSLEYIRE